MSDSPQLSPHISQAEYACHHCGALPPDFKPEYPAEAFRELFQAFESLRAILNRPIPIVSGYRCPVHNFEIDGAALSVHLFGLALDLAAGSAAAVLDIKDAAIAAWPGLRVGWRRYINSKAFICHIDVGYLISPRPSSHFMRSVTW